ncbi:long-chain fatty acid--CoA ligase [Fulvimarina endophytica]|uniref:Long-chain-fatty-acid--CoA ligase n=1 Tax=Fulvimarina endophytica TaxID=2293836 RepID=A0A371X185_9HYPH|nr:AMP-binding protein [Fulvimarina endophytica]RFC62947.1 long-chain fatty acid--CoA ligase [Fulvimarina endophytica]
MDAPWLNHYQDGVAHDLPPFDYRSLADLLDEAFEKHGDLTAFLLMGGKMSFRELDRHSKTFAAYLQSIGLKKGDRIALMMPNVFAYPVAVAGALRAGLIVVNTNPLYTTGELTHQLNDSGAKAIVVLENMANTVASCRSQTKLEHVIVTTIGDLQPVVKRFITNLVVRKVKKMVPAYDLPEAVGFLDALKKGEGASLRRPAQSLDEVAVLQYTGGTTGVSKGAALTHRNIVSNVLQVEQWFGPALSKIRSGEATTMVCALPLYHIFGFTVNMMFSMRMGGTNILIPNPRDIPALLKAIKGQPFHTFPGVNTLFGAIARHEGAKSVDWSPLVLSVGGGMAVQKKTAELWEELTGTSICEGYGLSETSPVASANHTRDTRYTGSIGLPLPGTEMAILSDEGEKLPQGDIGEIAIRGPQVMAGYWQRPDETARAMTEDGFFKTGDIGLMDENGWFKIVDRKKDMINVSGFNVYPNEIEDVLVSMPGIVEAAAVAVPDENSGEAVKVVLVRENSSIDEAAVKAYCREHLTGYKRPRVVEFREELPKTNVGKVLRRELRN